MTENQKDDGASDEASEPPVRRRVPTSEQLQAVADTARADVIKMQETITALSRPDPIIPLMPPVEDRTAKAVQSVEKVMLDVAKSSQTTAGAVSTLADAAKEEGRRSRLLVKLTVLIAVLALATLIATVWH
jgi:hypothetical protein